MDIDIPRDALAVFTGVSGSGNSSLAFGTLYAEAQRRYRRRRGVGQRDVLITLGLSQPCTAWGR